MLRLLVLALSLLAPPPLGTLTGDELDQLSRDAEHALDLALAEGGDLRRLLGERPAFLRVVFEQHLRAWLTDAAASRSERDLERCRLLAEQFETSLEDSLPVERLEHLGSLSVAELERWRHAAVRPLGIPAHGRRPDPGATSDAAHTAATELAALGDPYRQAEVLYLAGKSLSEAGESAAAIDLLQQALPIAEQEHAVVLQTQIENRLSRALITAGETEEALRILSAYERHATQLASRQHSGLALNLRSTIARRLGQLQSAQDLQEQALRLFEEIHDSWYQCVMQLNIALRFLSTRAWEQARERAELVQQLARESRYPELQARALLVIAYATSFAHDGSDADHANDGFADFEVALAAARGGRDQEIELAALFGYAQACERRGDLQRALELYRQGESLARSLRAFEAEVISGRLGLLLVKLGRVDEGLACLDRIVAKLAGASYLDQLATALTLRCEALCRIGRFADALASAEEAASHLERVRQPLQSEETRLSYSEGHWYLHPNGFVAAARAAEQDHRHGLLERGVELLERGRARDLAEMMSRGRQQPGPAPPPSARAIQQSLAADEALLLYTATANEAWLAVVTSTSIQPVLLGPPSRIHDEAIALREALRSHADCVPIARELHRLVLEPARRCLTGVRHLIIAPDGALWLVPFEVLVDDSEHGETPSFLLRRYAVSYVHSGSQLLDRREQRAAHVPKRLLAMGDPVAGDGRPGAAQATTRPRAPGSLERLPWSASEVEAIAGMPGLEATVLLRDAATEHFLKSHDLLGYDYLHFACHGLVNEHDPRQSQLILGQDADRIDDGRLSWEEVMSLSLDADLVVLSACRLQAGPVTRTEGLMSFSRAWQMAGARSVVLALWDVEDASSAELMRAFWTNLVGGGRSAAEALRLAKLSLLDRVQTPTPGVVREESYAHEPFFWAPWALVGR